MKPGVDSFKNLLNDLFGVIWLLQPPVDPIVQTDHVRGGGKVFNWNLLRILYSVFIFVRCLRHLRQRRDGLGKKNSSIQ